MKRAILWLNEWGEVVFALVLGFVLVSVFVGAIVAALAGYPNTAQGVLRGAAVGDGIIVAIVLLVGGAACGWDAAVKWAQSPPVVKPLPPEFITIAAPADEYLIAAKREVEAIAPEDS